VISYIGGVRMVDTVLDGRVEWLRGDEGDLSGGFEEEE